MDGVCSKGDGNEYLQKGGISVPKELETQDLKLIQGII